MTHPTNMTPEQTMQAILNTAKGFLAQEIEKAMLDQVLPRIKNFAARAAKDAFAHATGHSMLDMRTGDMKFAVSFNGKMFDPPTEPS